ncbi:MAG TPA: hypothetical protein VGD61_11625 [Pyrinomonadaceae bacterium]
MSLIEELFKHSEKNAQLVSVILLGVVIAGSISGGLWIQKLNSILAEKDKLEAQRLVLMEERYQNQLSAIKLKYQSVDLQIGKLGLIMESATTKMDEIAKDLRNFATSQKVEPQSKEQLKFLSEKLTDQASRLSVDLEASRSAIRRELDYKSNAYEIQLTGYSVRSGLMRKSIQIFVVLLVVLILIAFMWARRSSKLHRRAIAKQHLEKAHMLLKDIPESWRNELVQYEEHLHNNELEFAFDELDFLGRVSSPAQSFWMELSAAAENIGDAISMEKCRRRFDARRA